MYYTHLPQRGLLSFSGEDTVSFLQGLVSNDVTKLPCYAALLSPQGKYLHDFFLSGDGQRVLLDGEKHRLDDLYKRLSLYKLRSKVAIERLPESQGVVAVWGGESAQLARDPRLPELGFRITGDVALNASWCAQQGWQSVTPDDYDRHRLRLGAPDGSRDLIVDKTLLLESGFEPLHGVDFQKGCYVGQEVTARSKYRGQVRKALYTVHAQNGELPEAGTPILAGDVTVGEVRSHAGELGLAFIREEEYQRAQESGVALTAGGVGVTAALPVWASSHA